MQRWSQDTKARFIDCLARGGDVRGAAKLCGMSRQSVYQLRQRDTVFARDWDTALREAREDGEVASARLLGRFVEGLARRPALNTVNPVNTVSTSRRSSGTPGHVPGSP